MYQSDTLSIHVHESKYAETDFLMKVFPSETGEIYHWDSVNKLLAVVHATCFRCQKYEHQINPHYPYILSYPSSSLPCVRSCLLLEKLKKLLLILLIIDKKNLFHLE